MAKKSIIFQIENRIGRQDEKKLKSRIDQLPGVLSVSVNAGIGKIAVDFDSTGSDPVTIKNRLDDLGYSSVVTDAETRMM